jgi:MurNAc alpha-1-phosphate uridylyltransferase
MRPLTNDRPKALVEVAGRALVDHTLDRLAEAGVERAVVNVHYFADRLEAHVKARRGAPAIVISDERETPLETGGGVRHALPLLGEDPFWVANIDCIWIDEGISALDAVAAAWDPARMDICLMLTATDASLGFHDSGDVFLEADGRVRFKEAGENAPYVYVGAHITKASVVAGETEAVFSLAPIWRTLAQQSRVFGVAPPGYWMHVGDPAARDEAEARLAQLSTAR